MNDQIDRQLLEEMTGFDPSPDIKNIMVTGGNGFMYVAVQFCVSKIYHRSCTKKVPKADNDLKEVLGSSEPLLSPIKTIITSSPSTSSITAPP